MCIVNFNIQKMSSLVTIYIYFDHCAVIMEHIKYSGTSRTRLSEKRTQYQQLPIRDKFIPSRMAFPIVFNFQEKYNLSTRDKLMFVPSVSFINLKCELNWRCGLIGRGGPWYWLTLKRPHSSIPSTAVHETSVTLYCASETEVWTNSSVCQRTILKEGKVVLVYDC